MYNKPKYLFFFFTFFTFSAFTQTKYSNEFLQIGAGARSLSLSKTVVASTPNSSSVYWNPSSLVDLSNSEIELLIFLILLELQILIKFLMLKKLMNQRLSVL